MQDKDLTEKQISSEDIFRGVLLHVKKDGVLLPNGNESVREYLDHRGAVAIVAMNEKGEVCMEHQFRYPMKRVITEIPAGKLDGPNEPALDAAKRELKEETGLTADSWELLGQYAPSVAYTNEIITIYLATNLHEGERCLDDDEFLNFKFVPLKDLVKDVLDGKIIDGKTQVALLKAALTSPLESALTEPSSNSAIK